MVGREPIVSVIVPAYNVEAYLERCVTSILEQTYDRLEVLLVDDGSTDSTPLICDRLGERDSRIVVLYKRNGGLSDARNYAIDRATGEYLLCVDADDFIHSSHVNDLAEAIDWANADVAVSQFSKVDHLVDTTELALPTSRYTRLSNRDALERMFYQSRGISNSAWGKLYSRDVFGEIRYPKGELQEDLATTYKILARSRAVVVSDAKTYMYAQRPDSITYQKAPTRRLRAIGFAEEALRFVSERFPSLVDAASTRVFMECIFVAGDAPGTEWLRENGKQVVSGVRVHRWTVLKSARTPGVSRLYAFTSLFGLSAVRLLSRLQKWAAAMRMRRVSRRD